MYFGVGATALYLMLTGGFIAAGGAAFRRRDGASVLMMAVAAVLGGHLARLPSAPLVWACTVVAVALVMSVVAVGYRLVTGSPRAFTTGLVGTVAMLAAMFASGETSAASAFAPLTIGVEVHAAIAAIIAA